VATTRDDGDYPGRRLGLPEAGPGSLARFGRRAVAVCLDWAVALLTVRSLLGNSDAVLQWATLGLFAVAQAALVGTLGGSLGHLLLRMRVVRLDGGPAGPARALARSALLVLAVPPMVWDRDQRGLHDRFAGTVLRRI
jgi:uncharacterized RDD family membrane protein YckC